MHQFLSLSFDYEFKDLSYINLILLILDLATTRATLPDTIGCSGICSARQATEPITRLQFESVRQRQAVEWLPGRAQIVPYHLT